MGKTAVLLALLSLGWTTPALDCSRPAGSLPNPHQRPGTINNRIPIDHIVIIMQENHSFDNYFGALSNPQFYGAAVDGLRPGLSNPDKDGALIPLHHTDSLCQSDPDHQWNGSHQDWNKGANDGFVRTNGPWVMNYFNETDIPYYYALANRFAIGDRYFCSLLGPTFPNRFFMLTGTAFGHIQNDLPETDGFYQPTLFDVLNKYGITWKYYKKGPGYLDLFQPLFKANQTKMATHEDFKNDLDNGWLPQVSLIDFSWEGEDEHPDDDVQLGQSLVAEKIEMLTHSPAWQRSALFLMYDEGGGFYDHVAPPAACVPDRIAPMLHPDSTPGRYDRLGFRVPLVVVSPFAKRHFVSHTVYDHTSVLKFIESKFNLPALTARDANANGFTDMFDYQHPNYDADLPKAEVDPGRNCAD